MQILKLHTKMYILKNVEVKFRLFCSYDFFFRIWLFLIIFFKLFFVVGDIYLNSIVFLALT